MLMGELKMDIAFKKLRWLGVVQRVILAASVVVATDIAARADTKALVLLCKGTQHCSSCSVDQRQVDFDWTYTVDFDASTVDGHPATISGERITWQFAGNGVLDEREINRFSKKLHFAGKPAGGGAEIYYGDGDCEPQTNRAY
jgi:hypothetical protein